NSGVRCSGRNSGEFRYPRPGLEEVPPEVGPAAVGPAGVIPEVSPAAVGPAAVQPGVAPAAVEPGESPVAPPGGAGGMRLHAVGAARRADALLVPRRAGATARRRVGAGGAEQGAGQYHAADAGLDKVEQGALDGLVAVGLLIHRWIPWKVTWARVSGQGRLYAP